MENKHAEISEYKNMTLMRIPEHEEENNDEQIQNVTSKKQNKCTSKEI